MDVCTYVKTERYTVYCRQLIRKKKTGKNGRKQCGEKMRKYGRNGKKEILKLYIVLQAIIYKEKKIGKKLSKI